MVLNKDNLAFVIPALNEEALIGRCITAIHDELPWADVIVVDNGSTDRTIGLAQAFGARVIEEPRRGVTQARQTGLEYTTKPYVAFIDADCTLSQGWLQAASEAMDDYTSIISGPSVYPELMILSRLSIFSFYCVGRILHTFFPMVQGGNFIVKRSALMAAGGFATDIDFYGEDTDTAIRLKPYGKVVFALGMYSNTSARRFLAEGLFKTGLRYATNYFWMHATGRPFTKTHVDHREETEASI